MKNNKQSTVKQIGCLNYRHFLHSLGMREDHHGSGEDDDEDEDDGAFAAASGV